MKTCFETYDGDYGKQATPGMYQRAAADVLRHHNDVAVAVEGSCSTRSRVRF
jgi:hypothetical protein